MEALLKKVTCLKIMGFEFSEGLILHLSLGILGRCKLTHPALFLIPCIGNRGIGTVLVCSVTITEHLSHSQCLMLVSRLSFCISIF